MPIKPVLILCTAWLLTSCSGGEQSSSQGIIDSRMLVFGLWNLSPTPNIVDDERAYIEISEFEIVSYFYQGDRVSNSRNCYLIDREPIEFISDDTISTPGRENSGESNISATVDTLTISFVDISDDDSDGNTQEVIVETFPRVNNISSVDLNECA